MTNLTEKLDEVQLQMATQHDELLTAIGAINTKLDALGDTFEIGGTAWSLLSEIAEYTSDTRANTTQIDNKLHDIYRMFTDQYTDGPHFLQTLLPDVTASRVALEALVALGGGSTDPTADNQLALTRSIYNLLLVLLSGFGSLPAPGASTALGLLQSIKDCSCEDPGNPTFLCEAPWINANVIDGEVVEFGDTFARSIARWTGQLPPGVTYATEPNWHTSEGDATIIADWSDWHVFFQSTTATEIKTEPDQFTGYGVNTWHTLPNADGTPLTFFTDAGADLIVTMCLATDLGGGSDTDCTSFDVLTPEGTIERVTYVVVTNDQPGSVYFDYTEGDASLLYVYRNVGIDQPIADGIHLKTLTISVRYWEFLPGQGTLAFATDQGALTTVAKVRVCFPPEGNPDDPE